ncbi:MAG: sigma-54 dependent transcriptional regulator [Candidatus Eisenbacteria bacterium]
MSHKILLADDDESLRRVMEFRLRQDGYDVSSAADGVQAWRALEAERFDLLISDMRMPELDGLDLMSRALKLQPRIKVILITAYATVQQAVEAVKLGAFDYITKPFEQEELGVVIKKALDFERLESENMELRRRLESIATGSNIVGTSRAIRRVIELVEKVAPTDAIILITGDTGTGKEVVARAIHGRSPRASHDFIPVNCAAFPRELIESELFGHVKGAFTGAIKDKKGKFRIADGGTIFLDEIGDLAVELQAKILRVVQDKVVEPIGSEKSFSVDTRVIAATNTDLRARVQAGTFREDLFYRLNVVPILVPPLRDRKEDIPLFLRHFAGKLSPETPVLFAPELVKRLSEHGWPGNVRELENVVERMMVLRSSSRLEVEDLPPELFGAAAPGWTPDTTAEQSLPEFEKKLILRALAKSAWNKSLAARVLGIPRHVLLYRMKKHGIPFRPHTPS